MPIFADHPDVSPQKILELNLIERSDVRVCSALATAVCCSGPVASQQPGGYTTIQAMTLVRFRG
jgi:hypothetical protein